MSELRYRCWFMWWVFIYTITLIPWIFNGCPWYGPADKQHIMSWHEYWINKRLDKIERSNAFKASLKRLKQK